MQSRRIKSAPKHAENLLGDFVSLSKQVGSPQDLFQELPYSVQSLDDIPSLAKFLTKYVETVLGPVELPAICSAYFLCANGKARELVELDQQLALNPALAPFARASHLVGSSTLRHLRSLKDQRLIQRYIAAVEKGDARGWNPLVYAVMLSTYSLPLREGMLNYGYQTIAGFTRAATPGLGLFDESALQGMVDKIAEMLPRWTVIPGPLA